MFSLCHIIFLIPKSSKPSIINILELSELIFQEVVYIHLSSVHVDVISVNKGKMVRPLPHAVEE